MKSNGETLWLVAFVSSVNETGTALVRLACVSILVMQFSSGTLLFPLPLDIT